MAKTYQNILDEARVLLQDSQDPVRYTDEVLLAKLNRGLQELARLRPDAFWDRYSEELEDILVPEVVETDDDPDTDPDELDDLEDAEVALSDNLDISLQFYGPLVYWVTASAEIIDDEFTSDGRASMLMAQFKAQVVTL
jgi:hypothetical protein